jgi:mono/diheme cytochrome c family protein
MSNREHDAQSRGLNRSPDAGGVPEGGRLDLQPDVERLHRAIQREPRDPIEGREPTPLIMWAIMGLALFWGGWYLGRYGGVFGVATHVALDGPRGGVEQPAPAQAAAGLLDPVAVGQAVFRKNCQACHQQDGRGMPNAFPPLVGSEWVTGPEEAVVHILLDGLQGQVTVAGATYNGAMPAWRDVLNDQEIAAVATYIRQWAPNQAPGLTLETVARLRQETAGRKAAWSATELQSLTQQERQ